MSVILPVESGERAGVQRDGAGDPLGIERIVVRIGGFEGRDPIRQEAAETVFEPAGRGAGLGAATLGPDGRTAAEHRWLGPPGDMARKLSRRDGHDRR